MPALRSRSRLAEAVGEAQVGAGGSAGAKRRQRVPSRRGEKRILGASQDLERFFGEMRKVYRSRRERGLGFVSPYSVGKKLEQRIELLHR
ncbi:MAG: hypothetical protein COV91_02020 [Candidatus Taylorbacteria bacterium CG11_big_fil_rev_8_21_14_0_20_46_11]|uniref:Uncharacterized protein n=1 Tax=Candidatus Taylorbacteria bacterium CG11_big_fil_rev_8_21_14_0_20_46_11 TaxID=1975025 RepID=A0A2H0KC42_9BACT|nr:MAG: hypothetical protein COV91_02020 [Candidatus Taylorbacteria bacterium CG11_big_fil_rev_8_21_14_0_20_46_11]